LNPLTQADDLKTIFSRFGSVLRCDVAKDRKTKHSMGYAFVEYETKEACEEAYLKMNNVLIDDRRIKVDFCHSVKKVDRPDRRAGTRSRSRSGSRSKSELRGWKRSRSRERKRSRSHDRSTRPRNRDGSRDRPNYSRNSRY